MSAETEAPVTSPAPRYRYFTVPPSTVTLTVEDLTAFLPPGAWIGTEADKRREIPVPTAEILQTNFPRIRLSRLSDLLPGCIQVEAGAPDWIALPTNRIALAYRPGTRREAIIESAKEAAPSGSAETTPVAPTSEKAIPSWKRLLKPALAPPPVKPPAEGKDEPGVPAATPPEAQTSPIEAIVEHKPPTATPAALADLTIPAEKQSRLQRIFMTEDEISVPRLIDLAGALPGLAGCVLIRNGEKVRSSGAPAALDELALIADIRGLITGLGKSSGLRFEPSVTLYTESSPLSLLGNADAHLLVIHRERGFLPGVREKLNATLDLLFSA